MLPITGKTTNVHMYTSLFSASQCPQVLSGYQENERDDDDASFTNLPSLAHNWKIASGVTASGLSYVLTVINYMQNLTSNIVIKPSRNSADDQKVHIMNRQSTRAP